MVKDREAWRATGHDRKESDVTERLNRHKGFCVVKDEDFFFFFLEFPCFFYDPTDVGNLISGSSAFSKCSLNIWKFLVHILLKPGLENFEHYFASV